MDLVSVVVRRCIKRAETLTGTGRPIFEVVGSWVNSFSCVVDSGRIHS